MQLFRGVMRVNASDRSQAYVTLKGLTADIFVKVGLTGSPFQRILLSCTNADGCAWLKHLCTSQYAKLFLHRLNHATLLVLLWMNSLVLNKQGTHTVCLAVISRKSYPENHQILHGRMCNLQQLGTAGTANKGLSSLHTRG